MPKLGSTSVTYNDPYYEQLLTGRTIQIMGPIETGLAARVIREMHFLQQDDPRRPITLEILSPGGEVYPGLAIIDAAKALSCPVSTIGIGLCASMGAVILACAGTKGERYITPNTGVLLHQLLAGAQGQQSDIEILADHVKAMRDRLDQLLANAMGTDPATVHSITDRDHWLTAEEALKLGVVDHIVGE